MEWDVTSFIQKRIARSFLTQEYAPVEESVLTDIHNPHVCKYWLEGECWRKETCVYQHKALDLSNENVNDDEDLEFKKINDDDNAEDSVIESESEPQHRTDSTNGNPESLEVESIGKKRELTTDEILELYEHVELINDETISAEDIIKMYETDVEGSDSTEVHKTSRRKKVFEEKKVEIDKNYKN